MARIRISLSLFSLNTRLFILVFISSIRTCPRVDARCLFRFGRPSRSFLIVDKRERSPPSKRRRDSPANLVFLPHFCRSRFDTCTCTYRGLAFLPTNCSTVAPRNALALAPLVGECAFLFLGLSDVSPVPHSRCRGISIRPSVSRFPNHHPGGVCL